MILAIDVGNTTIEIGIIKDHKISISWRLQTDQGRLADEYGVQICQLLRSRSISASEFKGGIISSVVPSVGRELSKMCQRFFNHCPLKVSEKLDLGIRLLVEQPEEIGADRLATAVGAYHTYKMPLIVVDFGTATTYDAISPNGDYLGGAITPGIGITMNALFDHAALLRRVDLTAPKSIIGTNTSECIKSGFYFGFRYQMEGIIDQMKSELIQRCRLGNKSEVQVVATGGLVDLIAEDSKIIDHINSNLLLKGLGIIYHRHQTIIS